MCLQVRNVRSVVGRALVCAGFSACLTALAACGLSPVRSSALIETDDPLEPINRQIWAFNTTVTGPLDDVRDDAPSGAVWRGIHNVLVNLREPLTFANDLAQGRDCAAGAALRRFMVNSTLGVGGIFDVARELGVPAHDNDFGQTLAVWGVPSGPFLMVPILGPWDARAATATAVEFVADPVDLAWRSAGLAQVVLPLAGADLLDRQLTGTDDASGTSSSAGDGYAAMRDAYRRNLAAAVADDKCPAAAQSWGDEGWRTEATRAEQR